MSGIQSLNNPHRVVRASAGSGKTHRLAGRYLELLLGGAEPGAILAVTFTRKAAAEILDRVMTRLARAALDEKEAAALGRDLGRELSRSTCGRLLQRLVDSMHRISITTLDGFFYRLASHLRFELGLQAAPRMGSLDEPLEARLRNDALQAALDELAVTGWPQLRQLLGQLQSGARRSVSTSLDALLLQLYEVYRRAPDEAIWSRVEIPSDGGEEALRATFDALRQAIAAMAPGRLRKAIERALEQTERGQWGAILDGALAARLQTTEGEPSFGGRLIATSLVEPLRALVAYATRQALITLDAQTRSTYRFLHTFDRHYQRLRDRSGMLLFSDLPRDLMRRLAALGDDSVELLYYRLDGWVEHLLLDEFQDTSVDQWRVLRPIAEEIRAHGDGSRTLFCVGDPKQAIYGWRGGCSELFDELETQLHLEGGGAESRLEGSFRSSQIILDIVNRVFSELDSVPVLAPHRQVVAKWSRAFDRHWAQRELPSYVELRNAGNAPSHAEWTSERLAALLEEWPASSLGVLVQTNDQASRLLSALRHRGVAASAEGGTIVDDDPAVALVQSALFMADHPGDRIAAYHVHTSPLAETLGLATLDAPMVRDVARDVRRQWLRCGSVAVLARWIEALDGYCDHRSRYRLGQLIDLAERFEGSEAGRRAASRPSRLAEYIADAHVEDPLATRLRVMTIHRAKGLEFDVVVLPELDRALLGGRSDSVMIQQASALQPIEAVFRRAGRGLRAVSPALRLAHEQHVARRIRDDLSALYVALTRPRQGLFMWPRAVASGKPGNSELERLSFASILRQTLCADAPRSALERQGEALLVVGDPRAADVDSGTAVQRELPFSVPRAVASWTEALRQPTGDTPPGRGEVGEGDVTKRRIEATKIEPMTIAEILAADGS